MAEWRTLIVEDAPAVADVHRRLVARVPGFVIVGSAATAAEARRLVAVTRPHLMLLDLGLPDGDGLAVLRRLPAETRPPVIVLSARGQEGDKVTALDAGAEDYLTKPFGAGELLARIRVALRHTAGVSHEGGEATFTVGEVQVDLLRRHVLVRSTEVKLTPIEYKLLATLVKHAGKVVTHQQLLREVWGPGHEDQSHYVRVYMAHLRHKLESEPARPRYLLTEPGVGYRLTTD